MSTIFELEISFRTYMRRLTFISIVLLFSTSSSSQKLVNRIDRLISSIESTKNLTMISRCDTIGRTHSDYTPVFYHEFYSDNNQLFKVRCIVNQIRISYFYDSLLNLPPQNTGTTSDYTLYFHNDTLIKAIIQNFDQTPITISQFYFAGNDLTNMESRGLKATDEYKRAAHFIGVGYEHLDYFKAINN